MPVDVDNMHMHKHKCGNPKCGTVWRHSYKAHGRLEYHRCPECGEEQWDLFQGDQEASITQEVGRRRGRNHPPPECA